jgi:ABC-type sugar transport system substrate-binding protein
VISRFLTTTFIGVDNRSIGRLAGEFIRDELRRRNGEAKGKMVEIRGLIDDGGEVARYEAAHAVFNANPGIEVIRQPVANWSEPMARQKMLEILRAEPHVDVVYAHSDAMAVGAYSAAHELGREHEMFIVGIDAVGGPDGGIKKVMEGEVAATFYYPLCVDKAVEIGNRILREPGFKPEKRYLLDSIPVTPQNAQQLYEQLSF